MKKPNSQGNREQEILSDPTMMEVARDTFKKIADRITKAVDKALNNIFDTTETGGTKRRWLFIGLAGVFWAWVGYQGNNPGQTPLNFDELILYPLKSLFAPVAFRRMLAVGLAFWLAIQLAANYLDDVFELSDYQIAEKYILQASLANRNERIEIKEGKVSDKTDSTVVKIGGPGLVKVHFDSAALVENAKGEPTVILAEDGFVSLDRFERLRKVLLLRDHIIETKVSTRTRDGIPITADGVRLKYHVLRDSSKINDDKIPYPIVRKAVETLVYKESVFKKIDPLDHESPQETPPERSHPEVLPVKSGPIQGKLRSFISRSTLGEFLASISKPEIQQQIEDTDTLEQEALELTGQIKIQTSDEMGEKAPSIKGKFYTRSEITDLIYDGNDQKDKLSTGIELDWIDIGTWELPENAKKIAEQHLEAWQLSLENLVKRSPQTLSKFENESKVKILKELTQEIIFSFQTNRNSLDELETINKLLEIYMQKLARAQEASRKLEGKASILLSKSIRHLSKLLKRTRTI